MEQQPLELVNRWIDQYAAQNEQNGPSYLLLDVLLTTSEAKEILFQPVISSSLLCVVSCITSLTRVYKKSSIIEYKRNR